MNLNSKLFPISKSPSGGSLEVIPSSSHLGGEILLKITMSIGQVIKIDSVTLKGQRAKFARVYLLWNLKNDIILTVKCCKKTRVHVKELFSKYGMITDQRINFDKFDLFFPKDYPKKKREELCNFMGIKEDHYPLAIWVFALTRRKITLNKGMSGLDIRDLKLVKISLHAKRILPFMNRKDTHWVNLLNLRYKSFHPWNDTRRKPKSWIVKGIFAALHGLKNGLEVKIGNGCNTNIWSDPWVDCIPLSK
ncbi:hypothetical protein Cni_G10664 [Canna indica]|uniref:Uncharacterized protein n=1 Tax=Canna indica TaxID=4628 RepID=A0AAQ3K4U9_9LILI|nr:hypothetical protein Cni_G10664 [Canna indica]